MYSIYVNQIYTDRLYELVFHYPAKQKGANLVSSSSDFYQISIFWTLSHHALIQEAENVIC